MNHPDPYNNFNGNNGGHDPNTQPHQVANWNTYYLDSNGYYLAPVPYPPHNTMPQNPVSHPQQNSMNMLVQVTQQSGGKFPPISSLNFNINSQTDQNGYPQYPAPNPPVHQQNWTPNPPVHQQNWTPNQLAYQQQMDQYYWSQNQLAYQQYLTQNQQQAGPQNLVPCQQMAHQNLVPSQQIYRPQMDRRLSNPPTPQPQAEMGQQNQQVLQPQAEMAPPNLVPNPSLPQSQANQPPSASISNVPARNQRKIKHQRKPKNQRKAPTQRKNIKQPNLTKELSFEEQERHRKYGSEAARKARSLLVTVNSMKDTLIKTLRANIRKMKYQNMKKRIYRLFLEKSNQALLRRCDPDALPLIESYFIESRAEEKKLKIAMKKYLRNV